jgi:hypothetical protein
MRAAVCAERRAGLAMAHVALAVYRVENMIVSPLDVLQAIQRLF